MIRLLTLLFLLAPVSAFGNDTPELFQESYALEANYQYEQALKRIERVPSDGDLAYVVPLRKGWLLYLLGRYADSVEAYEQALAAQPAVEARLGLSLPLMALRRWGEAEETCRKVLEEAPGNYLALSRLSYILYSAGRYAPAEAAYQEVVNLFPADMEMQAGLGWSQLKQGKIDQAKKTFAWVLKTSPDYSSAAEGLEATSK